MKNISIEIPSLVENIRIVESFVDNAKEEYNLTDDLYGNIMIAVIESVNNAIIHGNKTDKNKNVLLSATLHDEQIVFIVSDEGQGFNHQSLPDPTAPENIEKVGGRGIFLIKNLADEVSFKSEGRTLELTFYLN
ncbi:MAG: serine/threonine-protein kinase RsbW [Roseivirga sp.]|jgi:serine/threonine-protein kinase RsbW